VQQIKVSFFFLGEGGGEDIVAVVQTLDLERGELLASPRWPPLSIEKETE